MRAFFLLRAAPSLVHDPYFESLPILLLEGSVLFPSTLAPGDTSLRRELLRRVFLRVEGVCWPSLLLIVIYL